MQQGFLNHEQNGLFTFLTGTEVPRDIYGTNLINSFAYKYAVCYVKVAIVTKGCFIYLVVQTLQQLLLGPHIALDF